MERKRLVNRANAANGFRWRGDCRLREHEGPAGTQQANRHRAERFGFVVVMGLALMMASCVDYEGAYEQSVKQYRSGQPKVTQPADSGTATTQTTTTVNSGSNGTISDGSGSGSEGSSSGAGSDDDVRPVLSGASGVILPGQ